jgi:hypothetical protein
MIKKAITAVKQLIPIRRTLELSPGRSDTNSAFNDFQIIF